MLHQITVIRDAICTLETTVRVEAGSVGQAQEKAIAESINLGSDAFSLAAIDLSSIEGSERVE